MEESKKCGNCKWHEGFNWVCFNGDAEDCADYTDPQHSCPHWERKDSKYSSDKCLKR